MSKKSALGKGLGALISDVQDINIHAINPTIFMEIPLDRIVANPYQPRDIFEDSAIEELAESIKMIGVVQPITVRALGDKFQIISGERRVRASRLANKATIPAYIRKTDDQGMLEMAIVENIQREDLNSMEVAISFQRLISECSLTQEMLADRVGKKRATVTNYLRILKLPAEIQLLVREDKLSLGHAKTILGLEEQEKQIELANKIVTEHLSVREAEKLVQLLAKNKTEKKKPIGKPTKELPESYCKVLDILGGCFEKNISLKRSNKGKGQITIQFNNDTEMETFLKILEKGDKK